MTNPNGGLGLIQSPASLSLEITSRCNLRCSYCYHFDSVSGECENLPTEEWLRFIEELQSLKVLSVIISGGEPFMRPDLFAILQKCADCRIRYTILTNGTLITEADAAKIAEIGRSGVIQVSLDGIGEVNDRARGKGSFEKAVRGIRNLMAAGLKAYPNVTLSHHNISSFEETVDFMFNELGVQRFGTIAASVSESNSKDPEQVEPTILEYAEAMRAIQKMLKKYPGRIQGRSGPCATLREWRNMLRAKRDNIPVLFGGCHASCGMVFQALSVRSDGAILPCTTWPTHVLGYINRDKLADVWKNSPFLNELRECRRKPLSDYEYCRSCDYAPYCIGACPAVAWQYNDGTRPSCAAHFCLQKFLEVCPNFDFEL